MKKIVSLFLSLAMIFTLSIPASALDVDSSDDPIQTSFGVEKAQVSAEIVEEIFANHALSTTTSIDIASEQELSTDDIDNELSHIYIDIERARKDYLADSTSGNEFTLSQLIQRKDFLENTLKSRGFIFLTDNEAQQLLGASSRATGSKPADTDNTQYAVSPILSVTLSDKTEVKYYYVTAYAESTDSNMVRRALIEMDKAGAKKIADFIDALVETYVGKLVGTAASLVKGVAWLPYEMLTYSDDISISCSYTVQATYTTTPRFIWALSESLGNYQLEGVTHSTYIEDHHAMTYVHGGKSHTDSHNSNYTRRTDLYSKPGTIVKNQWETYAPKAYAEIVENIKYYYQKDEDKPSTKKLVKTERVPYAVSYMDMN